MKKIISLFLMLALFVSCCACATNENTESSTEDSAQATEATEGTENVFVLPDPFASVDETAPIDGVYQIHSDVGMQQLALHPDADFKLLCDIDMQGATLTSVNGSFTGNFDGGRFTVSSFTLEPAENGDVGIFGVLEGTVKNFNMADVTLASNEKSAQIGSLAAVNHGTVSRCTVSGTLTVEKTAENASIGAAVGTNAGTLQYCELDVDLCVTAQTAQYVGGLAGQTDGGLMDYCDTNGSIEVRGGAKTVGLLAGAAKDTAINACAFVGEKNTVDGALLTDFTAETENVEMTACLRRDNTVREISAEEQALRDKVVQKMYDMGTIEWTVDQPLKHTCNCSMSICNSTFNTTYTYYGLPYNHKNGSLARMQYIMDEDGTLQDWVYDCDSFDTFDVYMGNDCSSALLQAWLSVSNKINFMRTTRQNPAYGLGTVAVGDYEYDLGYDLTTNKGKDTTNTTQYNGEQVMYEAYAQLLAGDGICFYEAKTKFSGHSRMVSRNAVVVRDQDGRINGDYSYILCHEQGRETIDEVAKTYSTWGINTKYTFAALYGGGYLPTTVPELAGGAIDTPEAHIENDADGKPGLTTGVVKANYSLDSVHIVIADSQGNTVYDDLMWPSVSTRTESNSNDMQIRQVVMEYDLARFATVLHTVTFERGETYRYTITANLATDDSFAVKEGSFTNGEV